MPAAARRSPGSRCQEAAPRRFRIADGRARRGVPGGTVLVCRSDSAMISRPPRARVSSPRILFRGERIKVRGFFLKVRDFCGVQDSLNPHPDPLPRKNAGEGTRARSGAKIAGQSLSRSGASPLPDSGRTRKTRGAGRHCPGLPVRLCNDLPPASRKGLLSPHSFPRGEDQGEGLLPESSRFLRRSRLTEPSP